jgi:transcription antitermination factor NusG
MTEAKKQFIQGDIVDICHGPLLGVTLKIVSLNVTKELLQTMVF